MPKDIQVAKGAYSTPKDFPHTGYKPKVEGRLDEDQAGGRADGACQAADVLRRRRRDQFRQHARDLLRELVELTGFPITSTLMGLGAYPGTDPQWLGMLGMHGTLEANMAMHDCDVMICIGARFDDRVTGRLDAFSPGAKKIHVDIDPSSINKNVPVDVPIVGDCAQVLDDMVRLWRPARPARRRRSMAGGSRSTTGARARRSPTGRRTR